MKRFLVLGMLCMTIAAMLAGCGPEALSTGGQGGDSASVQVEPRTSDTGARPGSVSVNADITREQLLHNPNLTYESSMEEIIAGERLALDPDHWGEEDFYKKPEPAVVGGVEFERAIFTFEYDKLSMLMYKHDDPEQGEGERLRAYLTALLGEPQDLFEGEDYAKVFWRYDLGDLCSIHVTLYYDELWIHLDVSREQYS